MHHSKKRKYRANNPNRHRPQYEEDDLSYTAQQPAPDLSLFIQAHEADLQRGPQALEFAKSLEAMEYTHIKDTHQSKINQRTGGALIQWLCESALNDVSFAECDEGVINLGSRKTTKVRAKSEHTDGIWVDRYDARLLLHALPDFVFPSGEASPIPGSPGWSDLPSDAEDTFFFTPGEADDYRNEKRRRLLDQEHEARVKARMEQDGETTGHTIEEDPWGGSDEEPDDTQKDLMRRTAAHLLSSPTPTQLEMRILANHGADKRFAFLKGRWNRTWRLIKLKAQAEKEAEEKGVSHQALGLLAGYGSDSNESNDHEGIPEEGNLVGMDEGKEQEEAAKQELRRQRAKEWAKQRRLGLRESEA